MPCIKELAQFPTPATATLIAPIVLSPLSKTIYRQPEVIDTTSGCTLLYSPRF
jgi:hypothetical protein